MKVKHKYKMRETGLVIHVKKSVSKSHTVIGFLKIDTFNMLLPRTQEIIGQISSWIKERISYAGVQSSKL